MRVRSNSYLDPGYDEIEERIAAEYGVPIAALRGVRTRGERSNANQVSEAGARSVYQFTPDTRRRFMRRYGVDAWSGPENAARAAALHLRDDYRRTGSWDTAVVRYHGGPNPANHGPRTRAYSQRVGPVVDQVASNNMLERARNFSIGDLPVDQSPEAPKLVAPVLADAGPSVPVAAPDAGKPQRRRRGILGALANIVAPEPDSFWAGALRDGLWNARDSQATYRQGQATAARTAQAADVELMGEQADLKDRLANGTIQIAGNNIIRRRPGQEPEIISPPPQPGEQERLITMWNNTPEGPLRELIARAIRGAQYTPEVIDMQGEARARAAERGAVARGRNRAPTASERNYGLPSGFVRR